MKFNTGFFEHYLRRAPLALALERSVECEILAERSFEYPILDIGCGDGIFATVLFAESITTGIDPDASELDRARASGAYQELICCGGACIPKPDKTFRTIFSNSVLEHIPELGLVLKEAHRLLAPGGRFYVTVPTDRAEANTLPARLLTSAGLDQAAKRYSAFHNHFWRHFHANSPADWRSILVDSGFEVLEETVYSPRNFATAFDLSLPFAIPSFITKKVRGRWIAFPRLRRSYTGILSALLDGPRRRLAAGPGSSLVFFALTRR